MNTWTPVLFFSLIVIGAAFIDMIMQQTGLTEGAAAINESMQVTSLTLSDVNLGENNPIGSAFGGNILMTPFTFMSWLKSLTLDYSWLNNSSFGVIRYVWLGVLSAYVMFAGMKAAAAILQFLPFRR
jgi:hypothetical protein|tara:strand:+ start:603 stop:983 length:381 start_codon:yes stop_codon:yes gene_type:complete